MWSVPRGTENRKFLVAWLTACTSQGVKLAMVAWDAWHAEPAHMGRAALALSQAFYVFLYSCIVATLVFRFSVYRKHKILLDMSHLIYCLVPHVLASFFPPTGVPVDVTFPPLHVTLTSLNTLVHNLPSWCHVVLLTALTLTHLPIQHNALAYHMPDASTLTYLKYMSFLVFVPPFLSCLIILYVGRTDMPPDEHPPVFLLPWLSRTNGGGAAAAAGSTSGAGAAASIAGGAAGGAAGRAAGGAAGSAVASAAGGAAGGAAANAAGGAAGGPVHAADAPSPQGDTPPAQCTGSLQSGDKGQLMAGGCAGAFMRFLRLWHTAQESCQSSHRIVLVTASGVVLAAQMIRCMVVVGQGYLSVTMSWAEVSVTVAAAYICGSLNVMAAIQPRLNGALNLLYDLVPAHIAQALLEQERCAVEQANHKSMSAKTISPPSRLSSSGIYGASRQRSVTCNGIISSTSSISVTPPDASYETDGPAVGQSHQAVAEDRSGTSGRPRMSMERTGSGSGSGSYDMRPPASQPLPSLLTRVLNQDRTRSGRPNSKDHAGERYERGRAHSRDEAGSTPRSLLETATPRSFSSLSQLHDHSLAAAVSQHVSSATSLMQRMVSALPDMSLNLLESKDGRDMPSHTHYGSSPARTSTASHVPEAFTMDGHASTASLAMWHESTTILFADIVGFTECSQAVQPSDVMAMLNELYTRYDSLCIGDSKVAKIETIGDCYMAATGLLHDDPDHAATMLEFASAMRKAARQVLMPHNGQSVRCRIGIHSGRVMSGVVGKLRKRFCLFGDTVNTASRMESGGMPAHIHISAATRDLVLASPLKDLWQFECRGAIPVKGKGEMVTYFAEPIEELVALNAPLDNGRIQGPQPQPEE